MSTYLLAYDSRRRAEDGFRIALLLVPSGHGRGELAEILFDESIKDGERLPDLSGPRQVQREMAGPISSRARRNRSGHGYGPGCRCSRNMVMASQGWHRQHAPSTHSESTSEPESLALAELGKPLGQLQGLIAVSVTPWGKYRRSEDSSCIRHQPLGRGRPIEVWILSPLDVGPAVNRSFDQDASIQRGSKNNESHRGSQW